MRLELVHVHRLQTKDPRVVSFDIPLSRASEYAELIKKGLPVDRYDLRIETPRKKRSTGFRSQNSHTWGHYTDIAEQLSTPDIEYSKDEIARALKLMAMKEGYWPPKMNRQGEATMDPITKALEPMSEADADVGQAAQLIEFIHQWADVNGLWLTEYINEEPQRVYGGRARQV